MMSCLHRPVSNGWSSGGGPPTTWCGRCKDHVVVDEDWANAYYDKAAARAVAGRQSGRVHDAIEEDRQHLLRSIQESRTPRKATMTVPLPDPAPSPDGLDVPTGPDAVPGPPCGRCGVPLPPLPVEVRRALDAGLGVELTHPEGGCPTDDQRPKGRYFEVRVDVVEVVERDIVPTAVGPDSVFDAVEMLSFKHGLRADNLDAAMRPLALGLGEKWAAAEKRAGIADSGA